MTDTAGKIGVGAAIGSGVGAHFALASGTVTGAAFVGVMAAVGAGVTAAGLVGFGVGT